MWNFLSGIRTLVPGLNGTQGAQTPFSLLITLLFCVAIAVYSYRYRNRKQTPSVATTLGILGTFIGIVWGLFWFDTGAIKESIPQLLDGLRFAFITSIAGIISAILLKYRSTITGDAGDTSSATVQTLANLLERGNRRTEEQLESINRSLRQNDEGSLAGEIRGLETTVRETQGELLAEFETFREEITRQNTEALIEALEEVMRDFNARLNEHLGDNFKRLNEGIGRLLEWQKQYKSQLEELIDRLESTFEAVDQQARALESMKDSMREMSDRSESFVRVGEQLNELLESIQQQQGKMERHLETFSALSEQANQAFPVIEENLNRLTEEFSASVQRSVEQTEQALEEQRSSVRTIMENFEQLDEEARQNIDDILKETRETNRAFVKESHEMIQKKIDEIDRALEHELTQSLNSLGSQLASLSQKFASDYEPLTDKLQRVVEIAGRIDEDGRG